MTPEELTRARALAYTAREQLGFAHGRVSQIVEDGGALGDRCQALQALIWDAREAVVELCRILDSQVAN